jgi:hypothetical protein
VSLRRALLVPVALFALSVPVGGAHGMGEEHAESTVTIRNTAPSTFKGRVSSEDDSCIKGRAVKLIQDGKAISQGITDKNGVWRVALEGKLTGDFYAKVKSKRVGSLVCDADKSPTISV